jgi:CHAT domain-containing protein
MKFRPQRFLALVFLCLGPAGAAISSTEPGPPAETNEPGVVVEQVGQGSPLERAGLRPGDLLFAWERPPDPPANAEGAKGEIRTVFDWLWLKAEQAPRGTVRLHGERSGVAILFEVPKGLWDARTRPRMGTDLLQTYTAGRRRVEAGDLEGGVALWDELAQRTQSWDLESWILLEAGKAWAKAGRGDRAGPALQAALAKARDAKTKVILWEALGDQSANEMARAEASFRSALEACETASGESLQAAALLAKLGDAVRQQNRLDEAEQLERRALEIRQRWAPDSLEVAESLHHLTGVWWARGDLETMDEHARRALALQERWSPDSLGMAKTLNTLSIVASERGRFEEARAMLERALGILKRRDPDSLLTASILSNLGAVARARGDADSAVELLQRALAILKKLTPEGRGVSIALNNLGRIALDRGDLAGATDFFQGAQAIWRKTAPQGLGVAWGYDNLGIVARMRGDLDEAWSLHHRALEIFGRLAPGNLDVAMTQRNLGMVAEERGDLSLALDLSQQAETIYERLAPGTIKEALTLRQLGRLYRRMRRADQAAQALARAVDALESQVERLGGTQDLQATFRARHEDIYRDAIEVELERGHTAEAFHLMERSRARSFLRLLAERDLALSGELPDALERSRRDNAAHYDQTLRELARWTPAAGEEAREALHGKLSRLRREREEIAAGIRRASPRLAALRQPQPLDLSAARKVLAPGTLALAYSVGKDQTALFAVTREEGLRVEILPAGEERLRQDVEHLLEQVRMQEAPADLARSLYRTLIGPVADLVERSERVLLLPDGPMHRLPFGALLRDTAGGRQYLAEWKPFHTALSLTVYGTLRRGQPSQSARLVAFGDPRYPKDVAASGEVREVTLRGPGLRGFHWEALPYSRREVESIAKVYPGARLYLREDATEEQAKAVARDTRILHFATHGYLDDRTPLDSALVLTIPEGLPANRDNGLLQVWEIFESVRLDADLVVLSGCDTALGRELSGEGLIGLTRAFQYAGARSVVATLWNVTDQVTAELMARFHRHLAAGLSKDAALRAAQIELIRHPIRITTTNGQILETDASAPFFWAAFQLFGDWQ